MRICCCCHFQVHTRWIVLAIFHRYDIITTEEDYMCRYSIGCAPMPNCVSVLQCLIVCLIALHCPKYSFNMSKLTIFVPVDAYLRLLVWPPPNTNVAWMVCDDCHRNTWNTYRCVHIRCGWNRQIAIGFDRFGTRHPIRYCLTDHFHLKIMINNHENRHVLILDIDSYW